MNAEMQPVFSSSDYLTRLNPEQRRAVEHYRGPMLVLAGAGSGKTRVLTVRIIHLVKHHGVSPDQIMAVTFTNKAAGEMRSRIQEMLGEDPRGMWVGTFHQFGAWLLRQHATRLGRENRFAILDAEQSASRIKAAMGEIGTSTEKSNVDFFRGEISSAKNARLSPIEYADKVARTNDHTLKAVARVYSLYEEALRASNCMDFDDLLLKPVELLESCQDLRERYQDRFQFVLVDEYQDTNGVQYRLIQLLSQGHGNLMVVGDDDQSIYGWRGADIRNILDFEKDFPGAAVVRLEQNYRSTATILNAANAVIAHNVKRKGKNLRTDGEPGEKITVVEAKNDLAEATWIAEEIESRIHRGREGHDYNDFAVLYRTNAQSRVIEDVFRRSRIPYQVVGGLSFYQRREIKDTLAYLRLVNNPKDKDSFQRVVNYPKRGIGDKSVDKVLVWAKQHRLSPLEAAAQASRIPGLTGKAAKALAEFSALIQTYMARAANTPVGELLRQLVEDLELREALREEFKGEEGMERAENVRELIASAAEFSAERVAGGLLDSGEFSELELYLQNVTLVTLGDERDENAPAVTLMTMHASKGLEFPFVFLPGLEQNLFPHARSNYSPEALEEERRLFYVGITRAERKLYLLWAHWRRKGPEVEHKLPSEFLREVPESLCARVAHYS